MALTITERHALCREKGWALARPSNPQQEGCEKGTRHPRRAVRGVHYGSKFARVERLGSAFGLRDERVVVHSPVRRKLDRSERAILWRPANGLQLHGGLRGCLPSEVGHGRSLAHLGTATSRKERLCGAGMDPVAQHATRLRIVT